MLSVNYIRQNTALVKERLAIKHFTDLSLVDKIVTADEDLRKLKTETESLQAMINASSKEIGMLMGKGEKTLAETRKAEVSQHKNVLQDLGRQLADAERLCLASLKILKDVAKTG